MGNMNMEDRKEELVKDFHRRLMDGYGYQSDQLKLNASIGNGIIADIAIWRNSQAKEQNLLPDICVIVSCRAEHIRIDAEEYLDTYRHANLSSTNFFIAHNMKETKVYYLDDNHAGSVEQFGDFPRATDIITNDSLKSFVNKMRNNTKDNLIQAFSHCHNIIRNIDKLSPEAAFDEISKVIFIKMLYERKPDNELVYSKIRFLKNEEEWMKVNKGDYISLLFENVKKTYTDDHLFDEMDSLRIKRESFLRILEELEVIDFYNMAEDIKGVAFESFLGKTFRGELGQFFTPRTIVNYMVDVLDIKEGELVCDPCCGSGGFLIRAFEKVQDNIDRDIHLQIKRILASDISESAKNEKINALIREFDKTHKGSRYYKLCHDYFYGVDANVRMARTAKMNMIMHGDGHVGVYQHDGLLNVGKIEEDKFDVILINPPFGVHIDRSLSLDGKQPLLSNYDITASNAELLFIERCIRLLKPGGRAGLVLPEGVFNNKTVKKVREFVQQHAQILNITSIPADVFLASGANIKPSLLFIRKYTESEALKRKNVSNEICASLVKDAGINSLGLPSDNKQLQYLAPIIRKWIQNGERTEDDMVRILNLDDLDDWNTLPFFSVKPIHFCSSMPLVKLSDLLTQSSERITLEDDSLYTRITVKLFNKGIVVRDRVYGREIGTKKQTVVHGGQMVMSKIDGKSGAFAFLPNNLEGAIVTQDFPVFSLNTNLVRPEYLELILSNPAMLEQIKVTCSGSTGRKRLSLPKFLGMKVPIPAIDVQTAFLSSILELKRQKAELESKIDEQIQNFNKQIFE